MKIASFLYKEAELLDAKRYKEWLNLLTDDVEYKVFLVEFHPYAPGEEPMLVPIVDEGKRELERRINRLYLETAWAEIPPSHTLRIVSNVMIEKRDGDRYSVRSNLIVHRDRGDEVSETIYAKRHDEIILIDGVLKLRRRIATIPETIFKGRYLSVIL